MKKLSSMILALVFTLMILTSASADPGAEALPAINSLLQTGASQKAEVSDSLDEYSIYTDQFEDFDYDLKLIILQREVPEKEFTARTVYPPFTDEEGFPSDFSGVDQGETRVWLRSDLMQQIPPDYLAASMEEATYLIIAENMYDLDGYIAVSNYKETYDEELPEFENAEEMALYLLSHPKEVESVTYYPKFGVYTFVTVYETATKRNSLYGYTYSEPMRFARNPEASLYWDNMTYVYDLLTALNEEQGVNIESANELIDLLDFVPEEKKNIWTSCISAGEYSTARHSVNEYYWAMAEELKNLDPSEENRKNYDMIISERNDMTLRLFVNFCEYSGFERSVSSIESSKDYLGTTDTEWIESELKDFVDLFSE